MQRTYVNPLSAQITEGNSSSMCCHKYVAMNPILSLLPEKLCVDLKTLMILIKYVFNYTYFK